MGVSLGDEDSEFSFGLLRYGVRWRCLGGV